MTCPYFMPLTKLEGGNWPHPARLPLGSGWTGHCTAAGHEGEIPSQKVMETFCNLGYAGQCNWVPVERPWDAVRFAIAAPMDTTSRSDSANATSVPSRILRVLYVCERDHRPVERGDLEFDIWRSTWIRPHDDLRVQRMAECFLESYMQKKA